MKRIATTIAMALGLALPAMTFAQEEARPAERGRANEDRPPRHEVSRPDDDDRAPVREREFRPRMQERGGRPAHGFGERLREGGRPGIAPLFRALDRNGNGVLDEREIDHASQALRKLDRNGDGIVTLRELAAVAPEGDRSAGPRDEFREKRRGDREEGPGMRPGPREDEPRHDLRGERHEDRPRPEMRDRRRDDGGPRPEMRHRPLRGDRDDAPRGEEDRRPAHPRPDREDR